jgi:predicted kinase
VIIGGAPASGKTTLGRWLAKELRFPYIGKDDIKETLYDTLGTGDLAWSRRLGSATYSLLYLFLDIELRARRSVIVESNFNRQYATPLLRDMIARHGALPFQILCHADPKVLRARYQERAATGIRHPGHLDHLLKDELASRADDYDLLPIGGETFVLDTTDLAAVDFQSVLQRVRTVFEQ